MFRAAGKTLQIKNFPQFHFFLGKMFHIIWKKHGGEIAKKALIICQKEAII